MKGHKMHDKGGKVEPDQKEPKPYNAVGSNVEKEAEEKKHGGKAKKFAHGGHVDGKHGKMRLDRPGRKRGGRAGADMNPLSTASKVTDAEGHKTPNSGNAEEGP